MRPIVPAVAVLAAAVAVAVAAPLIAQQPPMGRPPMGGMPMMMGAGSPADVPAGTYAIEPNHTQVSFTVTHFGITPFAGMFSGASGMMKLDPAHPEATTLSVSIPVASVQTTSAKLTEELRGADWLDADRFPTATFVSSSVMAMGQNGIARIDGTLTLHGISKPASINARFFGTASNPMSKKMSVGFTGRLMFKRSDFGVTKYVPMVSDDTTLAITAAFEKQ